MATNKRKDAAALFELIDKSTLKVPKHAGSLKIPDWWSSKANPATEASAKVAGEEDLRPLKRRATHLQPSLPRSRGFLNRRPPPQSRPLHRAFVRR